MTNSLEDSDPSVAPEPSPLTTKSSADDMPVWGVDDLVEPERRRLGDYLALQTQKTFKNQYAIKPGSELIKLRTDTGNPMSISDNDTGAVNTYMNDVALTTGGQTARANFESLSDSGLLDTDTKFKVKKGKSDENIWTGTNYLNEINEIGGRAQIPQRIERVMLDNNRFAESKPYLTSGNTEGGADADSSKKGSVGALIIQSKLGQHAPGRFPKKIDGEGSDFKSIDIDRLKNFGLMTLLNASGEANVPTDLGAQGTLSGLGAALASGLPGLARIGQRVPVSRFDGVKILNDLDPGFVKPIRDEVLAGKMVLSHGNVNNPLTPFAGLLSASSVNSAQVLALAVSAMLRALYEALNALKSVNSLLNTQIAGDISLSEMRALRLGSHHGKKDNTAIYRPYKSSGTIDLVETKFPYFSCVNKGIVMFFGTSDQTSQFLASNPDIYLSAGWYNTVFRSLLSGTNDLIRNLAGNLGGSGELSVQAYDVDPNLGGTGSAPLDAITTAINYIRDLNNSRLLKFMNIMAAIGEIGITSEDLKVGDINDIPDSAPDAFGYISPKLGTLHMKSRLTDRFNGRLAWGSNTIKSMYLLPNIIKTAGARYDGDDSRFASLLPSKGFKSSDSNRLSKQDVESMEDYLEADYLPFYFHDLRTNEIVSFHAFLDSISDNYTVDYTENEGYGRVGKVLTYKNTDRQINLAFSVVATNEDDFSDMWFKINKMITLLYPQYTKGRTLTQGNNTFVQPFSQVIAASPMCRIRLGDIFKSNYNRFDLARIFGLANPEFQLETENTRQAARVAAYNTQRNLDLISARESISERMTNGDWRVNDKALLRPNQHMYVYPSANGGENLNISIPANITILQLNVSTGPQAGVEGIYISQALIGTKVRVDSPSISGEYIIPDGYGNSFAILESEIERQAQELVGPEASANSSSDSDAQQDTQAISAFFNSEGTEANPIFKSFESVRGRGLAGFIKSFNMDIDKSTTWETVGLNMRAPKMIKVNMSFAPIHDIQPGLDHNGYNTAPIYNIGNHTKQTTKINQADLVAKDEAYSNASNINLGSGKRGNQNR